ncbi:hypothetical protein BDV93DRAFT_559928 [Ceratobasidium sp. AG-I]|nr:hypothetical protein BDV93DRAFT_559928 [Ceratobasidium sp. AG-I]
MGFIRWIHAVTVKEIGDWDILLPDARFVQEINCLDGTLSDPFYKKVLCHFTQLYSVIIDAHDDVIRQRNGQFAYRGLVAAFPPSLRELTIKNAHGPDINMIKIVKRSCLKLERLTLQRCTMFNRASACEFWTCFPLDHDSYISSEGTDDYAVSPSSTIPLRTQALKISVQHSLVQELVPLRYLKLLYMGLYFSPSTIVLAHRVYHRRNLSSPDNLTWQQAMSFVQQPAGILPVDATIPQMISILHEEDPESEFSSKYNCDLCVQATSQISADAETRANAILSNLLPSLREVGWMSWLTPKHLGFRIYQLRAAV